MMKYKAIVFLLFFVCLFSINSFAQTKQVDEVLKLVEEYDKAWKEKDSATIIKILSPEYVYFTATGGTSSYQKTIDLLKSPKYKLTFTNRSEIETFCSGNTIVVSSRWIGKGFYGEEVVNDDQRCGLVFVKDGKEWKLVSENCTNIVSK